MNSVDVVIPCYNYARYLRQCVSGVLRQQGVHVRVLIIDDASTDHTRQIGERLAALDPRVEYRRHAHNRGHIATYNEGLLEWAAEEYALLLSADDGLAPGALARATGLMEQHPEAGLVYGMARIIADEAAPDFVARSEPADYRLVSGAAFLQQCCEYGNPVPTPTAVVRTQVQQRLGGYRPELPHTADMEMWMRFAMHGPVGVLRAVQGYYRRHEENMSARYFSDLLADQRERAQACMQALGQAGARLPQRDHWCRLMHRRLGTEAFWLASRAYDEMDFAASDACLRFAAEHHPRLRRSAMWWRFRAKRALGPALWQRVRPLLRPAHRGRGLAGPQFEAGDLNGWWPDAC